MIGSDIYVFWKNSTGGCVVSRRTAALYTLPTLSDFQNSSVIPLDTTNVTPSADKLTCSISRPLTDTPAINDLTKFVWAIGGGVASPDDVNSRFARHTNRGIIDSPSIVNNEISDSFKAKNGWSYFKNLKYTNNMERAVLMVGILLLVG
jgi:hypothetical protein